MLYKHAIWRGQLQGPAEQSFPCCSPGRIVSWGHLILTSNSHCSPSRNNLYNDHCYLRITFHSKERQRNHSWMFLLLLTNDRDESTISKVYSSITSLVVGSPRVVTSALYRRQRALGRKSCKIANIRILISL